MGLSNESIHHRTSDLYTGIVCWGHRMIRRGSCIHPFLWSHRGKAHHVLNVLAYSPHPVGKLLQVFT